MNTKVLSAATIGLDSQLVEVESDLGGGKGGAFIIVGLPDTAVQESRERVWSAIKNSDLYFPRKKIVVNLAPADIRKAGPAYDLPIALSLLIRAGLIDPKEENRNALYLGELSLQGELRPVTGILPIAIMAKQKNPAFIYQLIMLLKQVWLIIWKLYQLIH